MPSSYTTLLGLVQPVTGELTNTWGATVNTQLTQLVEDAIAETSTADVSSGNWTLSTDGGGLPNEARTAILIATGNTDTTRYIYAPKKSKMYVVVNNCLSAADPTLFGASVYLSGGPTSPTIGVEIESGGSALCAWDETANSGLGDFVKVAGGGGGASGGGNNQIFFLNDLVVTASYAIPTGKNSGTFGPITIDDGVTVTVPDGSVWSII